MKKYRSWIVLILVAVLLRLAMLIYWETKVGMDQFYFGDSETYWQLGKSIAEGRDYAFGDSQIFRMPGYPVLLAPLFRICERLFDMQPPYWLARLENVLFGTLTVLGVAWLAMLLFKDKTTALIAGWLVAIDPLNIVMSVLILSEAPFCFFMVLGMVFWIRALQTRGNTDERPAGRCIDYADLVLAGLFTAAAVYCRPDWLLFVPFAVILGIILSPWNFKAIFRSGLIVSIVLVLCMVPWWYRNYTITQRFIPTTLQTGPSLYDGLNPKATGGSEMSFVEQFRNDELKIGGEHKNSLEYRINKKMQQAALRWAWNNPDAVWKLATSKFIRLWNIWPNEKTLSQWYAKIFVACVYAPILILGIIGSALCIRRGFAYWLCWIPAVYITLLHIIFVSSIRYRAPAMICLAVSAAWILVSVFNQRRAQ